MQRVRSVLAMAALAAFAPAVHAQQVQQPARTAFNTMYVELGGNGLWYSMNYERIAGSVGLRLGVSYMSIGASAGAASANVSSLGFPLTASYLGIGSASHKLEVGAGLVVERFSGSASSGFGEKAQANTFYPVGTFILGYRYAPAGGGFNFKLAFTPVYHPDLGFFPWGGLSFGFGF